MKIKIILLICFSFFIKIFSQSENLITVDSITGLLDKKIPFDEKFILKTTFTEKLEVTKVNFFKSKLNEDFASFVKKEITLNSTLAFKLHNKDLYISIPPLKANKKYYFLVSFKSNKVDLENYFNLYQNYNLYQKENKLEIAKKIYQYTDNIDERKSKDEDPHRHLINRESIEDSASSASLQNLQKYFNEQTDTRYKKEHDTLPLVLNITNIIQSVYEKNNLNENFTEFNENKCDISINNIKCEDLKKEIIEKIKNSDETKSGKWVLANTDFDNFKNKYNSYLTLDFGLIYYGLFSKNSNGFLPYVGIQFEMSCFNKDIPLSTIPGKFNKFLHRSSINIGITMTKISENENVEDLFSTKSLIVGYSYKITNAFRFSGGALFYRQKTPYGIVERKKTIATPYVGLSLDLDLERIINVTEKIITL